MLRLKYNLLFIAFISAIFAKAQPAGFLGAVNGITLKTNMVPSQRFDCKILDDEEMVRRMKLINMSYSLSYSRVLTRNIEITGGYQFAKINFTAGSKWFSSEPQISGSWSGFWDSYFADHASAVYQAGFLALDFYRYGSLAPVGKYIGFSMTTGVTSVKEDSYFIVSDRSGLESSGFFSTRYSYNYTDSIYLDDKLKVRSFHLKARIGRNYPITRNLILNVGMSAPILSTYSVNGLQFLGFELRGDNNFDYEENDWRFYTMRSIRPYHRLQFEVALRLCI